MEDELWILSSTFPLAHLLFVSERRSGVARRYGETRGVQNEIDAVVLEIAQDLLALLLCIGVMAALLFLAGGR